MDPLIQQADHLFSQTVAASTNNLLMFVNGNENIVAIRKLTNQYLTDVANTLGVPPPRPL